MDKQQLLKQLEKAWTAIKEAYAGLSDSQLSVGSTTIQGLESMVE